MQIGPRLHEPSADDLLSQLTHYVCGIQAALLKETVLLWLDDRLEDLCTELPNLRIEVIVEANMLCLGFLVVRLDMLLLLGNGISVVLDEHEELPLVVVVGRVINRGQAG